MGAGFSLNVCRYIFRSLHRLERIGRFVCRGSG